ncbi:hypothetical protein PC9H_010921 [Pleurotus ostreatus]|uniref:BIR-domain-containing protein n=1 Tax=Pleurotus ostreatus TaxID=5322 RepID=A0A8H6ZKN2_PLEOS|nr:uncharacterized protein PC9H_010921 [Pleurotus ostreatus]KAF7422762.1 hypothetical protein PC9H_010921 [Pleurotus ostreatus]
MEAFQNRLDSFKPKKVKHGSKNVTLKWPHPEHFKANAQSLAEAGFYFDPSFDDKDAVKCFMCGKMLSEWEEEDDPFDIHWSKFVFGDKSRIPSSKAMEKARLATFTSGDWWPHDATDGHGAASTSMAQAGFVYTPQFPGDDLVTCLYCQISLSGWDEDDNPMEEHRKRDRKSPTPCPFFTATGSSKPASRASTKPRPKATGSKTHKPKAPSRSETVEDNEEEDDEAPAAVMKGAKTPRKPRGTTPSTAKTPGTLKRTKSKRVIAEEEDEEAEAEELPKPPVAKPSKSRGKLKQVYEDVEEDVVEEPEESKPRMTRRQSTRTRSKSRAPDEEVMEVEPLDIPKRQKKAPTKVTPPGSDSESSPAAESSRPPSTRTTSKSRAKTAPPDEGEVIESQPPRRQPPARPTNGHARKPSRSQSKPKVIPEPEQVEEPPAPAPPKKSSRTKATPMPEPIQQESDEEAVGPIPATKPKGKSKAAKSVPKVKEPRQQVKARATQQPDEDEVDDPQSTYEDAMEVMDEPELSPDLGQPDDSEPVSSQPVSPAITQKPPGVRPESNQEDQDLKKVRASPEPPVSVLKIGPPKSQKRTKPASSRAAPPSSTSSSTSQRPAVSTNSDTSQKPSHVVEILSDDDEDPPTAPSPPLLTTTKPKPLAPSKAQKLVMEVVLPLPPKEAQTLVADVQMADDRVIAQTSNIKSDTDEDIKPRVSPPIPQTPRPDVPLEADMNGSPEPDTTADAPLPPLPSFHPPLSTMPFQQLDQLTEAELDMTVEEWIRYQMSIEYGKFKRDGEREINRFKERAEEVRRAIAAL